jgi:hypothetical protein
VVFHEAKHALGLGHSDDPASVMYPYYSLHTGLTADDIAGVQTIYGAKVRNAAPPSTGSGTSGTGSTSGSGTSGSGTSGAGTGTATTPSTDTVPPLLTIVSPSSTIISSYTATIAISGTASDNVGVASVQWTTSTGSAGVAAGTTSWSAVIPLLVGDNMVTVRAFDAAGNSSWRAIDVVRQ